MFEEVVKNMEAEEQELSPPVKRGYGAVYAQFDIDAARRRFAVYEDRIQKMRLEMTALEVKDDLSSGKATEMISQVNGLIREIDDKRKSVTGDHRKFVRSVDAFVKGFRDHLEGIVREAKDKLGRYAYRKELERREAERKAREERERQQKKLDEAAKKAKVDPVKLPEMVMPEKREPVRSESGTASTRMVWTFEIMDATQLPREYLMPNEKAIKAAVDAGIRNIAGVKIYEKPFVTVRRN